MIGIRAVRTRELADKLAKRDFEKTLDSLADVLSFLSEELNAAADSSERGIRSGNRPEEA